MRWFYLYAVLALVGFGCEEKMECDDVWEEVNRKTYRFSYSKTGGSPGCEPFFTTSNLDLGEDAGVECEKEEGGRYTETKHICVNQGVKFACRYDREILYRVSGTMSTNKDGEGRLVVQLRYQFYVTLGNVKEGEVCDYRIEGLPL